MAYIDKRTGEKYGDREEEFEDQNAIDEHKIYDDGYDAASVGGNYEPELNPWPTDSYAAGVWEDGWNNYDWPELDE